MIQLVFLLLGVQALKPAWKVLVTAGVTWMTLGIAILFDLSDGKLFLLLDTFAIFLIVEGLIELAAAFSVGVRQHWIDAFRGVAFLIAAFLVFNVPWDGNIGAALTITPTIFGLCFGQVTRTTRLVGSTHRSSGR